MADKTSPSLESANSDLKDLREIQRQRWQQKKEEGGAASSSAQPEQAAQHAQSHSSTQPVPTQKEGPPGPLRKLHILPFAEAATTIGSQSRIDFIAPELRRKRAAGEIVKTGDLLTHNNIDFAITNCEPAEGPLGLDTDYFLDGPPVVSFEKIQFCCWGPTEMDTETLFTDCVAPYFKNNYRAYGTPGITRVRLLHEGEVFKIGDVSVHVEATLPPGMGVVTTTTEIFANWDKQAEFDKIHIVPFQDTIPRAYEIDIFNDYLKPYLSRNQHKKFQCNDLFTFQGIQFKVVAVEPPDVPSRVGKGTTIYCEGLLHPSLRNLLPPELLQQVSQLPVGLQMLLLNTERTQRELEDMLSNRRGLFEETLEQLERFDWPPASEESQATCMICLSDFTTADQCVRLPCRHVFHRGCVDEWLRRCTDCPICKANVDRALRNY